MDDNRESLRSLVAYCQVGNSIFIEIGCYNRHAVTRSRLRDARALAHISERPVAIVSIEPMPAGGQPARPARDWNSQPQAAVVLPWDWRLLKGKPHIVGDEKVQVPVAIVVHKAATGAPALLLTPKRGLLGQIRERAIAVIAVENVLPEAGAENVVKAVVVIVTHANATSPTN